jgi:ubiquinone/menaquinone biosynthesis C-methylase UbiE
MCRGSSSDQIVREYRPFPEAPDRNDAHGRIELPVMQRVLGLPSGLDVLEVGCGIGCGLAAFARLFRPRRLVGIDIDPTAVERARCDIQLAHAEIYEADARFMPFPDATFDVVFDFGTLWHIARPEAALAEIARVLRPGGYFVHETKLNQLASHPIRAFARRVKWDCVATLQRERETLLWSARVKA